jgi:hypothetical protein
MKKKQQETGAKILSSVKDLNPDNNAELVDNNLHDEKILEEKFLKLRSEKGEEGLKFMTRKFHDEKILEERLLE